MSVNNETLVFEINTSEDYALACRLRPDLSEITFEALHGHFFGLTGDLKDATFPPGFIANEGLSIIKGEFKPLNIGILRK